MKRFFLFILLLFTRPLLAQENPPLLLFATREEQIERVYTLNPATGEQRLIAENGDGDTFTYTDAGWTPDGRIWVVDSLAEGERRLRFFDAASGEATDFEENLLFDACYPSLHWSPDGSQLAYYTGTDSEMRLNVRTIADASQYSLPVASLQQPLWSSDGRFLFVTDSFLHSPDVLLQSADGTELLQSADSQSYEFLRFSPNSRYLAYNDESIWVYDIETGTQTNLELNGYSYQWSPTGRYLAISEGDRVYYYDTTNGNLSSLEYESSINFAAWSEDESSLFVYSDFAEYFEDLYPRAILRYDLATGSFETVLQTEGWVRNVLQGNGWIAIRYRIAAPVDRYSPNTHIRFSNGQETIDTEVISGEFSWTTNAPTIAWSPDGRWLSLKSEAAIYRFDSQTGSFESLPLGTDAINYPFWSPDSQYLAFETPEGLGIWNNQSDSAELFSAGFAKIIGWRDGEVQDSLLYCGIG